MSADPRAITISEWETAGPDTHEQLRGYFFESTRPVRATVDRLCESRLLEIRELRGGLQIRAFSHVGRLRIGDLSVTVLPKLPGVEMLSLLRYAYGFRSLKLISDTTHFVETCSFEDLLVAQLNIEAQDLLSRGLHRTYISRNDILASPRGRIDVGQLARQGGVVTAALPCTHFPRIEDTLLNRVLLAGLHLAGSIASGIELRRDSLRLASLLDEQVSTIRLHPDVLVQAERALNRLTDDYSASLTIIRLLLESQGIRLEGQSTSNRLPGFMFDMNAFFQQLMSRFLSDHLEGCEVVDEHGLKKMMRYSAEFNPQRKQSPTPRPDYAVKRDGKITALLDAKYRDLWEKPLPREMLYQLVVYAISQRQHPQSSILYPASSALAREARIDIADPVRGKPLGQVCLRPVKLSHIEQLLRCKGRQGQRARVSEANRLAFGPPTSGE